MQQSARNDEGFKDGGGTEGGNVKEMFVMETFPSSFGFFPGLEERNENSQNKKKGTPGESYRFSSYKNGIFEQTEIRVK